MHSFSKWVQNRLTLCKIQHQLFQLQYLCRWRILAAACLNSMRRGHHHNCYFLQPSPEIRFSHHCTVKSFWSQNITMKLLNIFSLNFGHYLPHQHSTSLKPELWLISFVFLLVRLQFFCIFLLCFLPLSCTPLWSALVFKMCLQRNWIDTTNKKKKKEAKLSSCNNQQETNDV